MPSTIATSLKLSAELKAEIDASAKKAGLTAHAFMVKTLANETQRARQREQFALDTQQALNDTQASGLAHDWDDVKSYFDQKAAWRRGQAAQPERPPLKPLGAGRA